MNPGIRRSLKLAFYACLDWENDQDVYTGTYDGWSMLISAVEAEPVGVCTNDHHKVTIVLTPRVVKHWAAHIRAKLPT